MYASRTFAALTVSSHELPHSLGNVACNVTAVIAWCCLSFASVGVHYLKMVKNWKL